MRILVFAMGFMILMALSSLARGLEITRIDARVDYDDAYAYRLEQEQQSTRRNYASVPIANNSRIDVDVFPGSNLTFTVTLENTFTGNTQTIKNIATTITIEGRNDGEDLEEESIDFDLEPGDDNKADVKFNIPFDIEEGTHKVIIEAEGVGKNDTTYRAEVKLKLDIKKLSHDIRITKVLLSPGIIGCNRVSRLTAQIANAGSSPENEVALEFKSPSIGVNSYDKDVTLQSSDETEGEKTHTKALNIEVPSFFKSGKYPIFVNLYWKNFVLFDQKIVDLVVMDCAPGTAKPKQEAKNETKEVIVIQPEETKKIPSEIITATEELPILNSPAILLMLLGNGMIIMIFAVLVIFGLLRKSRV